ncbi:hypothetical protein BH10PSE1_BH10PSE1_34270 [soil metagenome]
MTFRPFLLTALAIVATGGACGPVLARDPDRAAVLARADANLAAASAAFSGERWGEASVLYRLAWMGHRKARGWWSSAAAVDAYNLSIALRSRGLDAEAAAVRAQAIAERAREPGGGGVDLADLWKLEAEALPASRGQDALDAWLAAWRLYQAAPGHEGLASEAAVGVAQTYSYMTRPKEGLAHAEQAVVAARASGDANRLCWALIMRGRLKSEAGDVTAGMVDFQLALAATDPPQGSALDAMAGALNAQGRYDEAADALADSIAIWEAGGDRARVYLAESLNTLGQIRTTQRLLPEAEALYRRGIQIAEQANDQPQVAVINANLGWNLHLQQRYDEAEPLLRQVVNEVRASEGRETRNYGFTLGNLAGDLQAQGRDAEAVILFRQSHESLARIIGDDHVDMGWIVNAMARSIVVTEGDAAAEPWFRQGLELASKRLPPGHPETTERAEDFSRLLLRRDRPVEAVSVLRRVGDGSVSATHRTPGTIQSSRAFDRTRPLFRLKVQALWALETDLNRPQDRPSPTSD